MPNTYNADLQSNNAQLNSILDQINSLPENKSGEEHTVLFYDYDGTILYSYTKDQFLLRDSMPPLPSHEGLICQEWNRDFEDVRAHVQEHGWFDIGATYITDDGKTRIYVTLNEYTLNPSLRFVLNGQITIGWGDGYIDTLQTDNPDGELMNISHTYQNIGDYIITLEIDGQVSPHVANMGTASPMGGLLWPSDFNEEQGLSGYSSAAYTGCITKMEIGYGLYPYSLCQNLINLKSITLPNIEETISFLGATFISTTLNTIIVPSSVKTIYDGTFMGCEAYNIILPATIEDIDVSSFRYCLGLKHFIITSSPNFNTSDDDLQYQIYIGAPSLKKVISPYGSWCIYNWFLEYYGVSNYAPTIDSHNFQPQQSLYSTLHIPNTISQLSYKMFAMCVICNPIIIPPKITSIPQRCFAEATLCKGIDLGNIKTIKAEAFYRSYIQTNLLNIPDTVQEIGDFAFLQAIILAPKVIMSANITTIGSMAFQYCDAVLEMDFSKCTQIPTIASDTFADTQCKFKVPAALYDSWINATNWSALSERIISA